MAYDSKLIRADVNTRSEGSTVHTAYNRPETHSAQTYISYFTAF